MGAPGVPKFTVRQRPGVRPEHRSLVLSSLKKVSTCRTNGKSVSIKYFASRVISVFFCFPPLSLGLSNLSPKKGL